MEFEFGDIVLVPFPFKPVLTTIEKTLVVKKLGRLTETDRMVLPRLLSEVLGA